MNTKICDCCGETKPLSDFVSDRRKSDGRRGRCKSCRNKQNAERTRRLKATDGQPHECAKCHQMIPPTEFTHPSYCRTCYRELDAKYRAKSGYKERKQQYNKEWREKNQEHRRAYKIQRMLDPEIYERERSSANRRNRTYYIRNRQKCFDHAHQRRARLRSLPHEKIDRLAIANRDGWVCHICGKKVRPKDMSLDHLIPISQGGGHLETNVKLAHIRCNQRRGAGRIGAQLILLSVG